MILLFTLQGMNLRLGGNHLKKQKIELLAPAGSYEAFEAALGAGADAFYVGGSAFGARAYAQNFDREELIRAIETAHVHGKKLYLTVNTLLKNRELKEQLYEYLVPFYEAGLDAVIVQDYGVLQFVRKNFPGLHIHASTQMTVTGPDGMVFLEEQGADRVVAARELSLKELSAMHQASSIEIEAFIHGALCYSYSGQCLMSSLLGGRSGNRGRCAQTCRLPYEVGASRKKKKQSRDFCPLSLKDICTIDLLPEIIEAGVTSLKIEGRMKQPRYTAGVTAMYRKYLDLLLKNGAENYRVEEKDKTSLLELFNRGGSCQGYYVQHNGPSMMAFSNEKKTGDVTPEIRKRKEKIHGNLILFPESPAILEVSCRGEQVTAVGGQVEFAKSQPLEEERIRQQMNKLGNTEFAWEALEIQMDDRIFVPVKALNDLRREALEQLTEALVDKQRRKSSPSPAFSNVPGEPKYQGPLSIYVSCETEEQARAAERCAELQGVYLPFDVMKKTMEQGLLPGREYYLSLPHMTRGMAPKGYWEQVKTWIQMGMKGLLVRNLESFAMAAKQGLASLCVLDHSLYTWNDEAQAFWAEQGILRNTIPLELNEKELRHRVNGNSELLIYGYLPLMLSAQCVRKNTEGCDRGEKQAVLKDRYEKEFPSVCHCYPWKIKNTGSKEYCYNIIYNSIPYGLLREREQVKALGARALRLAFTMEDGTRTGEILQEFLHVYLHNQEPFDREFTKGHFKRGAE